MPDREPHDPLLTGVERRLPAMYLGLAGVLTTLLCLLTAPFFTPDEPNQACRAISLSHGALLARIDPSSTGTREAGAQIDENALRVMDGMNDIRMAWEKRAPDFRNRPYGAVPEVLQRKLADVRWAHHTVFVPFGNTAVYPPMLYLPAVAAWRLGEAADLTIFQSLRLSRLLCAWTAILLGWLSLRLAQSVRWPLIAFLLLPSTLFLNAACSQDSMLLSVAALLAALLSRPIAARRDFTRAEFVFTAFLLTLCGTARPPYIAMAFLLFLPRLELPDRNLRRWLPATAAFLGVLAVCGLWRHLVAPLGLEWADQAEPVLQEAVLRAHPFASARAILRGTADAAADFVHRGLYVIGWNDLLAPRALSMTLACCLAVIVLMATVCRLHTWPARVLLAFCIAAPLCGISLAEYIIWTPPGLGTVYGIQPRYWLPLMPLTGMLLPGVFQAHPAIAASRRPRLLISTAALLALIACTLPWIVAQAFYRDTVPHVLLLNLH